MTEKERLREERNKARVWFDILSLGCGEYLKGCHWNVDEVLAAVDRVNTDLVQAAKECDRLDTSYRPYWGKRRKRAIPAKSKNVAKKIA
jgi:hypothetical protein